MVLVQAIEFMVAEIALDITFWSNRKMDTSELVLWRIVARDVVSYFHGHALLPLHIHF